MKLSEAQLRALKFIAKRDYPAGEPRIDWIGRRTALILLERRLISERSDTAGRPFAWSRSIVDLTDAGREAISQDAA